MSLAALLPAWAERASKPSFKGMELYSWQENGVWRYALLVGTNRNKSWPEVAAAGVDESTLREHLARLAVGEMIFWQGSGFSGKLTPPARAKMTELEQLCKQLKLQLMLPPNLTGQPST
ncbi:MAG: hypothetical protein U0931_39390 [Vulcanimicrobiota bacterium]